MPTDGDNRLQLHQITTNNRCKWLDSEAERLDLIKSEGKEWLIAPLCVERSIVCQYSAYRMGTRERPCVFLSTSKCMTTKACSDLTHWRFNKLYKIMAIYSHA